MRRARLACPEAKNWNAASARMPASQALADFRLGDEIGDRVLRKKSIALRTGSMR
jgi:hypothetical protein